MQSVLVFHLCGGILVAGVDVEDIAIHFVEPDSSEELIKTIGTNDQRHSRGYRLILYFSYNHREAGLISSIVVDREDLIVLPWRRLRKYNLQCDDLSIALGFVADIDEVEHSQPFASIKV